MNNEVFKIRCWIPENNEMIYSDKLSENECYCMYFGDDGFVVEYHKKDSNSEFFKSMDGYKHGWDWSVIESIPMLPLPAKDRDGNQIYDNDILECSWSDYYDPCGDKYTNDTPVRFITDVYDVYEMPDNVKIVGNKYENLSLYRQTLWDLRFKDAWHNIEIESYHAGKKHTNWRKGQTLFNVFSAHYPKIAEQITITKFDCFNDDSKIEVFKERVIDLWIEEIQ